MYLNLNLVYSFSVARMSVCACSCRTYCFLVQIFIILIWKSPVKYNDLGLLAGFVTLKPSILSKKLVNIKSKFHTGPNHTGNISYKVTGGREIKFQLWTWLTGKSKGEKDIWSGGEFGEEDSASKFLYGIRYYKPMYRKLSAWCFGESCLAYFWKSLWLRDFTQGSVNMVNQ